MHAYAHWRNSFATLQKREGTYSCDRQVFFANKVCAHTLAAIKQEEGVIVPITRKKGQRTSSMLPSKEAHRLLISALLLMSNVMLRIVKRSLTKKQESNFVNFDRKNNKK